MTNRELSLLLIYGAEAILPTEATFPNLWSKIAQLTENNASLALDKHLIDQARDIAAVHMVGYK